MDDLDHRHLPGLKDVSNVSTSVFSRVCTLDVPRIYPGMTHTHINMYKGSSSRRADARLGSAHARNDRGCRQIEAVNALRYIVCCVKSQKKHWDQIH